MNYLDIGFTNNYFIIIDTIAKNQYHLIDFEVQDVLILTEHAYMDAQ